MGASDQNTRYYQRKPVFRHLPVSESDSWENQMPRAESFLKEEEKPFGVETEAISWNDEEEDPGEEPEPLFYITATRYEKGKPVQAKVTRIPIGPEGLVLGRIAFTTDSRFFFSSGSGDSSWGGSAAAADPIDEPIVGGRNDNPFGSMKY